MWATAAAAALQADRRRGADPADPTLKNKELKFRVSHWPLRKAKNSTNTSQPKLRTKTPDYSVQNYST